MEKKYKIDWNADGNWKDVTESHLIAWYKAHIENPDYTYCGWLYDMIKMDLIKKETEG